MRLSSRDSVERGKELERERPTGFPVAQVMGEKEGASLSSSDSVERKREEGRPTGSPAAQVT